MKLRPYQEEAKRKAVEHLQRYGGFCLFMEQRTGKTVVTLSVLQQLGTPRTIILCPAMAIDVWRKTIAKLPLKGLVRVMSLESLWNRRRKLYKWQPEALVIDESHRIKDPSTRQSKAARTLSRKTRYKLLLTGTPIDSAPIQFWAQYDAMDPTLFGKLAEFKERYCVMGGFKGKQVQGYKRKAELQEKLASRFFRVELEEVKQSKTKFRYARIMFPLCESRQVYDDLESTCRADLASGTTIRALTPLAHGMKLHQVSGGFVFDAMKVPHPVGTEKLTRLRELITDQLELPLVIVANYKPELNAIEELLDELGLTYQRISSRKRKPFLEDVALLQIRSGLAIDLSRAQSVVFYSVNRSYLDFDQCRFRIQSYTGTRAHFYFLLAEDTVDSVIVKSLAAKRDLSKALLGYFTRR